MATAALSGLFGGNLTPEEQQMQMTEARAAQFAKLDPSQQLAFMGYKAGANLGQGLAQAAGVDIQDPAIKRATQLRQLAQGIDVTSAECLQQYATRLQQAGFNTEAAQLGQQILAARKTESEILKNKRERAGAEPLQQLIRSGKYTTASIEKYDQTGKISDLELVDPQDKTALQETEEGVYLVNKKTGEKISRVGSPVKRGTNVNVGLSTVDKESNLRKDFTSETKDITQAVTTAGRIEKLLNMGSLGETIAQKQFAKLAGDNNISNRDVEALANFGDLGQRLAGTLSRFFEGTYSESQRQEALKLVKELRASGLNQYSQKQTQYRERAKAENLPGATVEFIAPNLPSDVRPAASLPPEGTKLRNNKTGKIEIVRGGKLVPFSE